MNTVSYLDEYQKLCGIRGELEYRGNRLGAALQDALRKKYPVGAVINMDAKRFQSLFRSCHVSALQGGALAFQHVNDARFAVAEDLQIEFDPYDVSANHWSVKVHPIGLKKKTGLVLLLSGLLQSDDDGCQKDMLAFAFG